MNVRLAGRDGALLIAAVFACGAAMAAEQKQSVATPDFTGRWKLDKSLSEDGAAKPAATSGAAAGKSEPAPASSKPAESSSKQDAKGDGAQHKEEPTEITIAQNEVAITVGDKAGQRTYYPNGKTYKADEGASAVKSVWKDGALVFEKKAARGWKRTEVWQITPDKHLRVDIRIEGGGAPTITVKQVFERVAEGQ